MDDDKRFQLPFWLNGESVNALKRGAEAFFQRVENWAKLAFFVDEMTCNVQLLDLIAWERQIKRLPGESLESYRTRVKWAFANAQDSGSVAGMKRIFERLGVTHSDFFERQVGQPWDTITIEIDDGELSQKSDLINSIIRTYGRTCRTYQLQVASVANIVFYAAEFNQEQVTVEAFIDINYTVNDTVWCHRQIEEFNNNSETMVATL
ncbi:MAG: phage tail protein [Algicola sp.]|nr:phage tail protein [Algicola sp.]